MRALILFFAAFSLLGGCLAQPPAVPRVDILQYPATWTPAPTPTDTPLPPPATLVVQHTPGPPPTRDPHARVLPSEPHNGIGIWVSVTARNAKSVEPLVERANVIVTDGTRNVKRKGSQFLFLIGDAAALSNQSAIAAQYNGVVISNTGGADLAAVRRAVGSRLLLVSVPVTGPASLQETEAGVDGVVLENFLTDPDTPLSEFRSEADWKRDIDTLARISARPNLVVLTSARPGTSASRASVSVTGWLEYAVASCLLGANGTHTFCGFESPANLSVADSPMLALEIGTPLGGFFKQNGVYQRRFTRGLVLVNPTGDAHAFALSRNYLVTGGARISEVSIAPHTGRILLNSE